MYQEHFKLKLQPFSEHAAAGSLWIDQRMKEALARLTFLVDYAALGPHLYLRYGDPNASERQIGNGDGGHVGTPLQAVNRMMSALFFIDAHLPDGDRTWADSPGRLEDLEYPAEHLGGRVG